MSNHPCARNSVSISPTIRASRSAHCACGGRLLLLPFYWLTVVLIRAAGTAVGDFISGRNMLGLPVSTAVSGALFIALLVIWSSRDQREIAIAS
jgi:hypothetical protein